jgi:hypothetical protein
MLTPQQFQQKLAASLDGAAFIRSLYKTLYATDASAYQRLFGCGFTLHG